MTETKTPMRQFINTLCGIRNIDLYPNPDYEKRYVWVFKALSQALELGYKAGVRIDPDQPEWPVVQVELPPKRDM